MKARKKSHSQQTLGELSDSSDPLAPYLAPCEVINVGHPAIQAKAGILRAEDGDVSATARACFEWVRDHIKHSSDYQLNPVTCNASDVLEAGTGYCYAKAHLLAALLRANGIPAGLVYQRLSIGESGPPYCTHGLNAVHLPDHGWYRIDPRGNKPGVDAQFAPPNERLAFAMKDTEEYLFPTIYAEPLPVVVKALRRWKTWDKLYIHLPDVQGRKGR
jgi:transglutaminase-like putative cysteine protease